MEKMNFFAVVLMISAAVLTSACASKKQVVQQPSQYQQVANKNGGIGVEMSIPCVDESMDDNDYFREMGTATHINMQNARSSALQAAKSMIYEKLGGYVEGLASSYVQTLAGSAPKEDIGRAMRTRMDQVVQEEINHAQKTCEKMYNKGAEGYASFIAIQIPVKKLVDEMSKSLSEEERLRRLFDEEQFREYSDKQIQKMLENRDKYKK